tara:strand:- start:71691 stop:72347 length:657 start_codon:yes stop_codon:yes gene_type:complete
MIDVKIQGVYVGMPKTFPPNPKLKSAFFKDPVQGFVKCEPGHLHGDDAANKKYHGGPDRVIHHYASENFEQWKMMYPEFADTFLPGTFGENISTQGVTEQDVCIGDIYQLGSAVVQLSEGRKPCGFIDMRYDVNGIHREAQKLKKMGWFYRVLEAGEFQVGSRLQLRERPREWARLDVVADAIMNGVDDQGLLGRLVELEEMSPDWRRRASVQINRRR